MGTKVQGKSYLSGNFSMRELNQDSNGFSWPLFYGDQTVMNGQYYNGFFSRATADTYSGCDKDVVKRTMLEHEAVFKSQVYELHRLYQIQRDLMDEVKRKDLQKKRMAVESSLSSSLLNSQITSEDARKWQIPTFPLQNGGIEDIHTMQGSSIQAGPSHSQNGGSSKEVELLDSRPKKIGRKIIDLQLPADAYIDTEEEVHCRDEMIFATSSYHPNESPQFSAESGLKLFVGNSEKIGCQNEALRSDSYLKIPNAFADLNEPIPTEKSNTSRCFPKEVSLDTHLESNNGTPKNRHLDNYENDRRFSPMFESGSSKSISQGFQHKRTPTSSQPIQGQFNKAHEHPLFLVTDRSNVDIWRGRTIHDLEVSERNRDIYSNNLPESISASNIPSSYAIASSSDLLNCWSHSVSSWEKPRSSLNEKPMSVQRHPYGIFGEGWHFYNNPRPNSSLESELPTRNGFHYGSSSGSKEPLGQVPSVGYNHMKYSNNNHFSSENIISHVSTKICNGSSSTDVKSAKDVNLNMVLSKSFQDAVPQGNIDVKDEGRKHEDPLALLPWLRAKPSSKKEATNTGRDVTVGESSFLRSSLDQPISKNEAASSQMFAQDLKTGSGSNNVEASAVGKNDSSSGMKILGFPFLEKPRISVTEVSTLTSSPASIPLISEVQVEENKKSRLFDINLPCDAAIPDLSQQGAAQLLVEKKSNVTSFRHQIDLNSCLSEEEATFMPTAAISNVMTSGIDLEAPIDLETEELDVYGGECREKVQETPLQSPQHKTELLQDDVMRVAAEAMVAISSAAPFINSDDAICNSSEASVKDHLNWFVEIVSSCGDDASMIDEALRGKEGENNEDSSSEDLDYFESMTLKLTQTREEDYMPLPLVPENLKIEETGTALLPNRARKGQTRRGRQRRDFQRDILPGLVSLSRHEVTEDLQTFGGIMKATGHPWSALTRRNSTRNGSARGRQRAVVGSPPATPAPTFFTPPVQQQHQLQFVNIDVVSLDDRNLTGWGKITRRPRRQRCPAGNPPSQLT